MSQSATAGGFEKRLQSAAAQLDRARKAVSDAKEARDRIVLEAVDAGISVRTVGRWADLSHAGVMKVLAFSGVLQGSGS